MNEYVNLTYDCDIKYIYEGEEQCPDLMNKKTNSDGD